MAQLPQEFLTRMQDMLGDEFDAFLTSYNAPRTATVCGRRLLSAGAKRHDPGVPPPDRTG